MTSRRNWKTGWIRDVAGTAMVELALALPFLLVLSLGLIEVGRYTAYSILVGNAARAGAQVGAMGSTQAQAPADPNQPNSSGMDSLASQAACNDAFQSLSVGDASFSCTSTGATVPTNKLLITTTIFCNKSDGTNDPGCALPGSGSTWTRVMYIQVTASGKFTGLLHYPLLPQNSTMTSQSILQVSE